MGFWAETILRTVSASVAKASVIMEELVYLLQVSMVAP
jgi:hypothetical protein